MNRPCKYQLKAVHLTILWLLCIVTGRLGAQGEPAPLVDYEESVVFSLLVEDTGLMVDAVLPASDLALLKLTDLKLADADLHMYFTNELVQPRLLSFELEVSLFRLGKTIPVRQQLVIGAGSAADVTVTFADVTEGGIYLNNPYEIRIRQRIRSEGVSVGQAPVFRPRGRGITYSALGLGGGTLLWSQLLLDQQIEDTYTTYQQLWEDEALDDAGLAKEIDRLQDQQRWGQRIGYAAVGVSTLVLGYQWFRHRQRQRLYQTYTQPVFQLSCFPLGSPNGNVAMGLRLHLNF
jgi:hypothetical protein